jgi:3-hydroxy-9,10-secoandrosta-1,3,5(10)-triene-9,17-dione monooxygenase reductase component
VAAARRFRDVLGRFASGVTVVTAISNGAPVGMTCQSFSSVSLDPPLVLFIPAKTSRAWPLIQRAGRFCVNFLSQAQAELSNTMASRGPDKFEDIAWQPSEATGSPLFDETLGYVDCSIHAVHEAGDHFVVIGKVLDLQATDAEGPLLFYQGQYRTTER